MNLLTLIVVVFLVLLLIGGLPSWPHSQQMFGGSWGPSGIVAILLIIVVVYILMRGGL